MTDPDQRDEIESLIREACDAPPPSAQFVADLERRAIERFRRQVSAPPVAMPGVRRRRFHFGRPVRIAAALAAACVAMAVAAGVWMSGRPARLSPEAAARLEAEVARMEAEARLRLAGVERMLFRERRRRVEDRLARVLLTPEPLVRTAGELERAAAIMVASADHMHREMGLQASAVEVYRRTVRLFPGTQGAALARQRLAEIKPT